MIIAVTGGCGFIGSHFVETALANGHKIRIIDNLSTGKFSNLTNVQSNFDFFEGTILDENLLQEVFEGVDAVVHLAAIASVQYSMDHPLQAHEVNGLGTLKVLEAAQLCGVRKIVFASSAAVYGDCDRIPIREESPTNPKSVYAADKLFGEHALSIYHQKHGMETTALRFFNIYGDRQDPSSPYSGVISLFANAVSEGRTCTIFGDGLQTRDFVAVTDLAQVLLNVVEKGSVFRVMNVGSGKETTLLEALQSIENACGTEADVQFKPSKVGDIRRSLACVDRLQQSIGWVPCSSFEDGLADLIISLKASAVGTY